MSLRRKARIVGESLTVTIPAQIGEFYGIEEGTLLEWQPMQSDVFKIVKRDDIKRCRVRKKGTMVIKSIPLTKGKCIAPPGHVVV